MYWLDTAILATLCLGAGLGFWSGLLWQVARVVGLGLALYLAILANQPASELVTQGVQGLDPRVAHGVAYVGVFVLVYLVFFLLTRLAHKTLKLARLELADRFLGALLGGCKFAVVVALVCSTLAALPIAQEWMERSTLAPHFARSTTAAFALIPEPVRMQMNDNFLQARDAVQRKLLDQAAIPHPDTDKSE